MRMRRGRGVHDDALGDDPRRGALLPSRAGMYCRLAGWEEATHVCRLPVELPVDCRGTALVANAERERGMVDLYEWERVVFRHAAGALHRLVDRMGAAATDCAAQDALGSECRVYGGAGSDRDAAFGACRGAGAAVADGGGSS